MPKLFSFFILFLALSLSASAVARAEPRLKTLQEYDLEDEPAKSGPPKLLDDSDDKPPRAGLSQPKHLAFKQTYALFGPAIARGPWISNSRNSTLFILGVGELIHSGLFYLDLDASLLVTPSANRNFAVSGNIGGGLIAGSQPVLPFIGVQVGATNIVVSGKGSGFGFKYSPEIGFFPLKIKERPVALKLQYNWIDVKIADNRPSWYSLLLMFTF